MVCVWQAQVAAFLPCSRPNSWSYKISNIMYVSGSLSRQNYLRGGLRSALVLVRRLTFSWEPEEVASASGTTGTARTFCLLTWWKGSSSVLSSASQQRPQSLWDQHFIHMKDLMPLIQYFCLSRMMTPKQRSLWSHCLSSFHMWAWYTESCPSGIYLLSGKGAKRHRLAQGHTAEVSPALHSALHCTTF